MTAGLPWKQTSKVRRMHDRQERTFLYALRARDDVAEAGHSGDHPTLKSRTIKQGIQQKPIKQGDKHILSGAILDVVDCCCIVAYMLLFEIEVAHLFSLIWRSRTLCIRQ